MKMTFHAHANGAISTRTVSLLTRFERERFLPSEMAQYAIDSLPILHFINEKGTGAEVRPTIVSGIVTGDALVSYWCIFLPVPSNNPISLCKS